MAFPVHDYFEFKLPRPDVRRPVIVHVPHAGTIIPDETRAQFVALNEEIAEDLARSTDHAVDQLWMGVVERGATMFVSRVSRLVCDLERYDRDALEPCVAFGRGVLYTKTCNGTPLRAEDISPEMEWMVREMMLAHYYEPWQDMIADTVDYLLNELEFPFCTILDAHSFPDQPFPFETDPGPRPDICLGWAEHHTPISMRGPLVELFKSHGLTVAENWPYAGAFVPRRHNGREQRLRSLMIEVNRRLYWNEDAGEFNTGGTERVQEVLMEAFLLVDEMTTETPLMRRTRIADLVAEVTGAQDHATEWEVESGEQESKLEDGVLPLQNLPFDPAAAVAEYFESLQQEHDPDEAQEETD